MTKAKEWQCSDCERRFVGSAPDDVLTDPAAYAEEVFAKRAKSLARLVSWNSSGVIERWPGPLAFTYRMLQQTLGRGQVDSSALVLKDFAELVPRFCALVMARDVLEHGTTENKACVRRTLLGKAVSMGGWLELADQLARKCVANPDEFLFPEIATLLRDARGKPTALKSVLTQLVTWRNETIGHGVRGDDMEETMVALERFLGIDVPTAGLHAALAPHSHLFDRIQLVDGKGRAIVGAESVSLGHNAILLQDLRIPESLVLVDTGRARQLRLGPFLTARRCQVCNQVEAFHFDSLRGGKAIPDARLFNYERGHAFNAVADGEMLEEYGRLGHLDVHPDSVLDQKAISEDLARMLDEQSIERSYLSPRYLREPIRTFLDACIESGKGGVYWLRAPAHVGKTTFVQGLDPGRRGLVREEPLISSLATAVFYIRREYQFHPAQFADQLRDNLKLALNLRAQMSKLPDLDITGPDHRASFCRFLREFQELGDRPLLVVIDGLDEISEQQSGIAEFLPHPSMLPPNIHILLTSRREDELAPWLLHATQHLKAAELRDIDLEDGDYVALMREYCYRAFAKRPQLAALGEELISALLEKSDGRFLYFRFLVDRLVDGSLQVEDLARLTERPELLVPHFVDAMMRRYAGTPMADRIQRLLLTLAAAEESFETHQKRLPVRAQSPWTGLPIKVLSRMVEGQDEITSNLAIALYLLKPLLGTWRKDEMGPQYRLGIKGLREVIRESYANQLDHLHGLRIQRVVDAFTCTPEPDTIPVDIEWSARHFGWFPSTATRSRDVAHFENKGFVNALYNIGEFARAKSSDEGPGALDWCVVSVWTLGQVRDSFAELYAPQIRKSLALALSNRAEKLLHIGEIDGALSDYGASGEIVIALGQENPSSELAEIIAGLFAATSDALEQSGRIDSALAYIQQAIAAWGFIRGADIPSSGSGVHGRTFTPRMQERLATAHIKKGNLLAAKSLLAEAGVELARADEILSALQISQGDHFSESSQYSLAGVYRASGSLLQLRGDWSGARGKYDQSISMLETVRGKIGGEASLFRVENELASAYMDRGLARRRGGDVEMAIEDYDHSIAIWGRLSERRGDSERPLLRDALGRAHLNRGTAKELSQDVAACPREDFTRSIAIWEELRDQLEKQFPPHMMLSLSSAYSARAAAFSDENDHVNALSDYGSALALAHLASERSEQASMPDVISNLASVYMGRGNAYGRRCDSENSVADRECSKSDYSAAIEHLENAYSSRADDMPADTAKVLSYAYLNRGRAEELLKDFDSAAADYQQALQILLRLKQVFGKQFPPNMTDALATAERNLGRLGLRANRDSFAPGFSEAQAAPVALAPADLGSIQNPVRCQGVAGERDYLRRLRDDGGMPINYVRVGSVKGILGEILDRYDLRLSDGRRVTAYFDMYHPGAIESKAISGFQIADDANSQPP